MPARLENQQEGRAAASWLRHLSVEHCLLIAALADAADEVNVLLRLVDKDIFDLAELAADIEMFMKKASTRAPWRILETHIPQNILENEDPKTCLMITLKSLPTGCKTEYF